MSTAIQVVQQQSIQEFKSPQAIKARVDAIQKLMSEVLKAGTKENEWEGDYGVIPGTGGKPSLWKSGSEQILAMFEIAVDPIVEDLSTDDCYRYRVTCRLLHAPSGNFLGAGIGECSTNETKYKWKRTYSEKEFENTPEDRRKFKFSQYKNSNGMWEDKKEMLVRTEPADLANTILKMAKKRAQIDATLTVTGASSMFAQDTNDEDTPEDLRRKATEERKGSGKKGAYKPQEKVICSECRAEGGHLPSCKFNPKNQQTQPAATSTSGQVAQETKPATAETKPAQAETPKQEEKKPEPAAKPTKKGRIIVTAITPGKSKRNTDYLLLACKDEQGNAGELFVWHKHLFHEFGVVETDKGYELDPSLSVAGKTCILEMSSNVVKDKTYFSVEHIHEIGGVAYVDDKPVATPSAADVGFESTEEAEDEEEWDVG